MSKHESWQTAHNRLQSMIKKMEETLQQAQALDEWILTGQEAAKQARILDPDVEWAVREYLRDLTLEFDGLQKVAAFVNGNQERVRKGVGEYLHGVKWRGSYRHLLEFVNQVWLIEKKEGER